MRSQMIDRATASTWTTARSPRSQTDLCLPARILVPSLSRRVALTSTLPVTTATPSGLTPSTASAVRCGHCPDSRLRRERVHAGLPSIGTDGSSIAPITVLTPSRRTVSTRRLGRSSRFPDHRTAPGMDLSASRFSEQVLSSATPGGKRMWRCLLSDEFSARPRARTIAHRSIESRMSHGSRVSRFRKVRAGRFDQLLAQATEARELIDGLPGEQRDRPLNPRQFAVAAPTNTLLQNQTQWNQAVPESRLDHLHGGAERLHGEKLAP